MKLKLHLALPDMIFLMMLFSMIMPGQDTLYIVIGSISIIYILFNFKYTTNTPVIAFIVVLVFYHILQFVSLGGLSASFKSLNHLLSPAYGMLLQRIRFAKTPTTFNTKKKQIVLLSIAYLILAIRAYSIALGGYWSYNNIVWLLHSSILAYVGSVLAIEIYAYYKNTFSLLISSIFLVLPIIGALRQHMVAILPIAFYALVKSKTRKSVIIILVILAIGNFAFPLKTTLPANIGAAIEKKSGSLIGFLNTSESVLDAEDTFQQRYEWWQEAIHTTIKRNILFGHILTYRFGYFDYPSGMLHSQFISAFADGGLLLLISIIAIYAKALISAIKNVNLISMQVIYMTILLMAVNAWGGGTGGFIIFYIYGYYADTMYIRNSTYMRCKIQLYQKDALY